MLKIPITLGITGLLLLSVLPVSASSLDRNVSLDICYDFGCRSTSRITLSETEWRSVYSLFSAEDAVSERKKMKLAIAQMETLVGRHSPVHRDLAMNLPVDRAASQLFPGQLDCIDESINTTRFLTLFADQGLIRFHRVLDRAYRRSFLTQHWAAQIEELESGRRFVIDSWFEGNGQPPILVSSERWHDLSL